MLGAYVPGAHWNLWTDPKPYIASVDPSLLQDGKKLLKNAPRLAVEEAFRRPKFHFARIVYSMTKSFARLDSSNFWWSLLSPEVLSPIYRQRADHFVHRVSPLLTGVSGFIQAMFLAAFFIGLARRHWPILVLTSAVLLKILIHAVLVVQARYLVPVVAIELLVIALGAREALTLTPRWKPFVAILGGLVTVLFVGFAGLKAEAYVRNHDDHSQRTYRFTIYEPKGYGRLQCMIDQGRLTELNIQDASMMFLNEAPRLGEKARAVCQLTRSHKPGPRLSLQVIHPYYPGVLQGQMVERVVVNGKELFSCDLAAKIETNRFEVALDSTDQETGTIVVEVEALRPDIGFTWGGAGRMTFGLIAEERK
jgi:hypothetical protein